MQRAWQLTYAALEPADGHAGAAAGPPRRGPRADAAGAAWEAVGQPYPTAARDAAAREVALADGDRARRRRSGCAAPRRSPSGSAPVRSPRRSPASCAGQALRRPRRTRTGPLGLTGRELEVLRLVAAGQSNREIAAALVISPKTASVHVSNILGKLGAATRTEAAVRAHALHLFDTP